MKGLICGIKRMEIHDGDGLRTTVFFKGCPLTCIWCHNPESISFEKQVAFFQDNCMGCNSCRGERTEQTAEMCPTSALTLYGVEYEAEELAEILLQDAPFFKNSGGGVTLSGGECLAQPSFAVELAEILHKKGISVYIDTCGFVKQEVLKKILPYTEKFLFDIKAIDENLHEKLTGQKNEQILKNLQFLSDAGAHIEIRYPLVMGYNDGECEKIGGLLQGMKGIEKVKVLQYHRFAASRYKALSKPCTLPDTETLAADVERAVAILKSYGLNAVNGITE